MDKPWMLTADERAEVLNMEAKTWGEWSKAIERAAQRKLVEWLQSVGGTTDWSPGAFCVPDQDWEQLRKDLGLQPDKEDLG